jgi:hypothetical protein
MTIWMCIQKSAILLASPPNSPSNMDRDHAAGEWKSDSRVRGSCFRTAAKSLALFFLLLKPVASLHAQTIDDGIMLDKRTLFAGFVYSHDSWDQYWEGTLERTNGNIGTVTTQTGTWFGNYGITNRLNFIGSVPLVWTSASQGVLHSMKGVQDLTLAAKYSFLETPFTKYGSLRAIAVVSGAIPLTDYTPDFMPLSIGSASKRISGRFTMNYQSEPGWFLNGTGAYTWRGHVTLDRPYYYTDGHLYLTNEVSMPDVFDYVVSAGYLKHGLVTDVHFWQQRTQGGGDIRRQDMPFVSNRMNFSRVGVMVMHPIPKLRGVCFQFAYDYTIDGRNVGQSSTFTTGLMYRLQIHR